MAWLYKQKGSSKWWIGYRVNGKMFRATTGESDEEKAKIELSRIESLFAAKASGAVLEQAYAALSEKVVSPVMFRAEVDSWLMEAEGSTDEGTFVRYKGVMLNICHPTHLNATERGPRLADVTADQIRAYLSKRSREVGASTVNLERKILRMFFKRATESGALKSNPMLAIKRFKEKTGGTKRRPFTQIEMAMLYAKAVPFWKYMILGGFFTGLRMGDLATMEWQAIDWNGKVFLLRDNKTDKSMHLPIAAPLFKWLSEFWEASGKPAHGYLFPEKASDYNEKGSGVLSNEFYDLMSETLPNIPKRARTHKKLKGGRGIRRSVNPLSFHCLRHTFISLLKQTGASQAVAKELAGHSSDAMNDRYTHMPPEALAEAVAKLPQFTK